MMPVRYDTLQIGLANLVATPGTASSELDARLPHLLHEALDQVVIRVLQNEVEGIVAGSFQFEVGAVF